MLTDKRTTNNHPHTCINRAIIGSCILTAILADFARCTIPTQYGLCNRARVLFLLGDSVGGQRSGGRLGENRGHSNCVEKVFIQLSGHDQWGITSVRQHWSEALVSVVLSNAALFCP